MATRTLGVRGFTGQPKGGEEFIVSPLNVVGLTGVHRRKFDSIVNVDGDVDFDAIFGYGDSTKQDWYIVNNALINAKPVPINFKFLPFKGAGAVQASLTKNDIDSSPLPTLTLKAAYKDTDSYGVWDNNIGVRITHVNRLSFKIRTATAINATTIPLDSVVGIVKSDILVVTISSVDYGLKVTAIDEVNRNVTVTLDGATPIFPQDTPVYVKGFTITTFIKDQRGYIQQRQTDLDTIAMTMESDNEFYFVTILKNHPFFKGVDENSTNANYTKFPVQTTTGSYDFLASGADGSAPASTSDWTSLQSSFTNVRMNYFLNTGTTDGDVRVAYEEWCRTLESFPQYWQPIADYGTNKTLLISDFKRFMRTTGWNQMFNVYGNRFVSDPYGFSDNAIKKISVVGAVLGLRINAIYSGLANISIAESRFSLKGFVTGNTPIPEDDLDAWNDSIRTQLYDSGVNLVQFVDGQGVRLRNERTPSNNYLVRDGHIHIINQMIKFVSTDNLQNQENRPAKYRALQQMSNFLKFNLIVPLFQGNFLPYVVGEGAFRDVNSQDQQATVDEVARVIANRINNPKTQFVLGDANIDIGYIPYSVFRSIYITVFPEERT